MKQFKAPASKMEEYMKELYELGADSKEAIAQYFTSVHLIHGGWNLESDKTSCQDLLNIIKENVIYL